MKLGSCYPTNTLLMKSFFNWSGGKDSALALYHALASGSDSIEKLVTNINGMHHRISMHGVRESLLEQQAEAIGIPLHKILLPEEPTMQEYERQMAEHVGQLKKEGFEQAVFGDIFLEDLKTYRERQLGLLGITAAFPIWKRDTADLIREFIDLGFRTILVCISAGCLPREFAGREIDRDFLTDLPAGIDPCGENGEFHSFVFDGPIFSKPVSFTKGEIVYREYAAPGNKETATDTPPPAGFYFQELLPENESSGLNLEHGHRS